MADPLLCDYPLPLQSRLYPLGVPLDLLTNSELILASAHASWGEFAQSFDWPPVVLRIGVLNAAHARTGRAPVNRGHRNIFCVHGSAGEFGVCDLIQRFGFAWVTEEVARDPSYFRYFYLEAMGYVMVSAAYLAPIHAACLAWNSRGVLLCGESGAGKSSLAYACLRAGWTFVCDDASFLVRDAGAPVVTGNAHLIRLRSSAPSLFPEFTGWPVTARPDGKPTIEVATTDLANVRKACQTEIAYVLFLRRGETGAPSLSPFSRDEALRRWSDLICYGDDRSRAEQAIALRRLLAAEILEFTYSDIASAVSFLDATFRSGGEQIA